MEHGAVKSNLSLADLDADPAAVAAMDPETLMTLAAMVDDEKKRLAARQARLEEALLYRYHPDIANFGTHCQHDGEFVVKIEVPKKVKWDDDKLLAVCRQLEAAGEDPAEFVTFRPTVSETAFKSWPERFRTLFLPARTTSPGKVKITISRKDAA